MNTAHNVSPSSPRRILTAAMAGTAVEFYDFYIFGTAAALVFGPLFFPSTSASAQLLQAYMTFAIAFVARPIGALVFGHFGDRIGRKSTLVVSLLIMGMSTFAIALLPTFAMAGWMAPLLLCLLRFGQGFGLGGEWGGAALLAVENAPQGWRARYGIFPQLGAPVGFIASNGLFLILGLKLSEADFLSWGWRIPFLASAVLVGIGLWVRLSLTETAAFAQERAQNAPVRVPALEVLRCFPKQVIGGTFAGMTCFAIFYLATIFSLGFGTTQLGIPRSHFLSLQMGAILCLAIGILISGYFSDKYTPRLVLMVGCIGTVLVSFLTAPMLGSGSLVKIGLYLSMLLFMMGLVYGPLGSWLPGLFPTRVRYTGASLAFNVAGILGGALAPNIALYLSQHGGLTWVGIYLAGVALVSFMALLPLKQPA
jgi:MFS family permease